jgi:hypothetical protein
MKMKMVRALKATATATQILFTGLGTKQMLSSGIREGFALSLRLN